MHSSILDAAVSTSLSAAVPASNYTSDCFVTSERAYNEVLTRCLPTATTTGGYLGVGPCQNLTYIGALRPRIALVVDARIDNLLEHLIFKLLFERAETPLEYLALLFSRDLSCRSTTTGDEHLPAADPDALVAAFEQLPVSTVAYDENLRWLKREASSRWPLTDEHRKRVDYLYAEFHRRQLDITSVNESALARLNEIPTLRQVILARNSNGVNMHHLTHPDRFRYVKSMHLENRIVPMLGNLTSPQTTARISRHLDTIDERLDTIYLSNIEEFLLSRYLIDDGGVAAEPNPAGLLIGEHRGAYDRLVDGLEQLPTTDDALLIRFFFPGRFEAREIGVFPHLEPDLRHLHEFLRRYRGDRLESVFQTYL